MEGSRNKGFGHGFGFIEMLLVLAAILFLCYKALNLYFNKSLLDKETRENLLAQGVDTSNYKTIIDSAKEKVEEFNLKIESQNQGLENIR